MKLLVPQHRISRGLTLVEVAMALSLFSAAVAMTLQILATTSRHIGADLAASDLQQRTSGQMASMLAEFESIAPTQDAAFSICNQGSAGLAPGTALPLVTGATDGQPIALPAGNYVVGDSITFRLPLGTDANGIVWSNPIRYRWAPLVRAGVPVPNMGMLVREQLNLTGAVVMSTQVVEENVPPCDHQWDPTATPRKLPTGFAIVQADVEPGNTGGVSVVARQRALTICLQRVQNPGAASSDGSAPELSTSVQTIFLKTP
jgi:hypothetical protein